MNNNKLQNIHPLTSLISLYYVNLEYNWINTNAGSPAMSDVAVMQSHNTYVDYVPQNSLMLASPAKAGVNQVRFSVLGPVGDVVQISKSGNLSSWTSLGFLTNTTGSNVFEDTNASGTKQFYRAQE
jgi:hypothetical protein